jgi:hypothetical protein
LDESNISQDAQKKQIPAILVKPGGLVNFSADRGRQILGA